MSPRYTTSTILYTVVLLALPAATAAEKPVKVFILAGQSNMEGKAKLPLLKYQASLPENRKLFGHYRSGDGWATRDDVWIKFLGREGNLTAGYGSPGCIGPELEFGHVVGNHYDQQVLLIKTAWGGKSLYTDFRPPSAAVPRAAIDKRFAEMRKRNPDATADDAKAAFGKSYREMIAEVKATLKNLGRHFPQYKGQGYEIAGLIWFQGWNDMINPTYTAAYADNLVHFIQDVRRDLDAPKMPVVIGQMGVDGVKGVTGGKGEFKAAQAAAAGRAADTVLVKTDVYWDADAAAVFEKGWRKHLDEWNKVGSDYPYHYLGSAKTYCRIGGAFARAAIELDQRRAKSK